MLKRESLISKVDRRICLYFSRRLILKKYRHLIMSTDHVKFLCKKNYWLKRGFSATDVMLYSLNKHNYKNYLNEFDRWKLRDINGDYRVIVDDKMLFHEFTKDFLKMPKLIGEINNGKLYKNKILCGISELNFPVVFKNISTGGGRGFKFIDFKNGSFYINNEPVDEKNIFAETDNGIIEEAVVQNQFFSKFYPNSLNTLRIVSINDNGNFLITNAVFRMGTSRSGFVDNASRGGIFSVINLETGKLNLAHSYFVSDKFAKHPDTNIRIEGEVIPFFESIKNFVIENHKKLKFLKFIAWDIAVCEDNSFICIEANASSDLSILQCDETQKDKPLGKFLEKNGIIFK